MQADGALETALTYKVIEDSGTTVATVLLKGDLFLAAGLGDSRVVLGVCAWWYHLCT
jgi:serine/threonine protein phosphatase PrpC